MPKDRTLLLLNTLMLIALTAGALVAYAKIQNLEQQVTTNPVSKLFGLS